MPFSSHDDSLRHHRDASCQKEMRVSPLSPSGKEGRPRHRHNFKKFPTTAYFNLFHATVPNGALAPARVLLYVNVGIPLAIPLTTQLYIPELPFENTLCGSLLIPSAWGPCSDVLVGLSKTGSRRDGGRVGWGESGGGETVQSQKKAESEVDVQNRKG